MAKKGLLQNLLNAFKKQRGRNVSTRQLHAETELSPSINTPNLSSQTIKNPEHIGSDNGTPEVNKKAESRVDWVISTSSTSPIKATSSTPSRSGIEWGGGTKDNLPDLYSLIGIEDAYDHMPLMAGEKIAFCKRDQVAYHISTWEFLRTQNQGRCCICGLMNTVIMLTLPGVSTAISSPTQLHIPGLIRLGEEVVGVEKVRDFLGKAVIVHDYVHEVYCTKKTGTYFIRLEKRLSSDPVFEGFKIVVFPDYVTNWEDAGLSLYSYQKHVIRARGIVQQHPKWGFEIMINTPRVIEIVNE